MKYSVVIPTYNNCEKYLKPCIDSIVKYTEMTDIELVISANGCTDNTAQYLAYLQTAIPNLCTVWNKEPIGYAKAINEGIKASTCQKIVLLNNDTIFLNQPKNRWLEWLDQGDVNYVLGQYSPITQRQFGVFFCVMIDLKVFTTIGLLNEDYETGGCEDIEFCFKAEKEGFTLIECSNNGTYPIYHKAEGTMNDLALVQDWKTKFHANELKLAKKYNLEYYKYLLTNSYERAVFLKNDKVFPREKQRYEWANQQLFGSTIFELGCTTGYGVQFFPKEIQYTGIDYDPIIVEVAKNQYWGNNSQFFYGDINTYLLDVYDTIIAFEVIEHLDNGLEIVEKLKAHCKRLLITVPWNEPKGFWGEHHKLHGLNESHFSGFEFEYINHAGDISSLPQAIDANNLSNLMLCKYSAP
jgi:glycosyltransferase involved in cell wall biosynthesis